MPLYVEQSMRTGVGSVGLGNIDLLFRKKNIDLLFKAKTMLPRAAGILSNYCSELVCPPNSPNINLVMMLWCC